MSKKIIQSADAPAPIGPYSQAVQVGNMLYVSGQVPIDAASGEVIQTNTTEETHQVMKNLEAILRAAGSSFAQVVKCTIFIRDMGQFSAINEVYGQYFSEDPPARETVEVSGLPKDVNVEISCIATV